MVFLLFQHMDTLRTSIHIVFNLHVNAFIIYEWAISRHSFGIRLAVYFYFSTHYILLILSNCVGIFPPNKAPFT